MNQLQFELIVTIIQNGTPALANDLCQALDSLVKERNHLVEENDKLKNEIDSLKNAPIAEDDGDK